MLNRELPPVSADMQQLDMSHVSWNSKEKDELVLSCELTRF